MKNTKTQIRPKGTFDNEPALPIETRVKIASSLKNIMSEKNLLGADIARAAVLHPITVGRIKNQRAPFTQTVFNKLLNGLGMTENEFYKFG